jgi:preprotein translocase subunit SecB
MSQDISQADANQEMQFMIQRIYTKSASFETTHTPSIFQKKWEPELTLDINTSHVTVDKEIYEVILSVTATVKNMQETAFLVEVEQAGIFTVQGPKGAQLDHILGSFCPSILFPYVRESISSAVTKGSFPPLVIAPINFDALFLQQQEKKEQ